MIGVAAPNAGSVPREHNPACYIQETHCIIGGDFSRWGPLSPAGLSSRFKTRFQGPSFHLGKINLPAQFPILDPVRLLRLAAFAPAEILEVGRVISRERVHLTVAFKGDDVRCHPIEEPPIM